jgi:acetamidase/formamidase
MVIKEPRLRVKQGEKFVCETEDALNGMIRREDQLPLPEVLGPRFQRFELNPLAGPIYVEGAKPGDMLAVTLHDIVVEDQGVSCIVPGVGPLADSAKYPDCHGPFTKIIKHLPGPSGTTSDGKGVFNDRITWDLNPHMGTIGTTPLRPVAEGADSVFGQGAHGGNMDVRDVRKGNKVMLPVFHEGAYLYIGDMHASQGDSEYYGIADESRGAVTLSCEVVPNKPIPAPRIETPTSIIQLHSFRPLEDAIHQAIFWLIDWMVTDHGISPREAYMHIDLNPDFRIHVYQMVKLRRINYTVGAEIPKKYLQ